MLLLRTIFWIGYVFVYLIGRLPTYWRAKRLQKEGKTAELKALTDLEVHKWAGRLLRHLKIDIQVEGGENLPPKGETVVFVSNHQSFLDIPILLSHLDEPHGLLSKKEIGQIPLLNGWMNMLGCTYVDRKDMRSSIEALKAAEKVVKGGESYIIFPEGTRTKQGEVNEFKAGAMRIATKAKVRMIPIAIDGSYKLLEANGFKLKKGTVKLHILPGVPTEGLSREEQKALPEQLQAMVEKALQ